MQTKELPELIGGKNLFEAFINISLSKGKDPLNMADDFIEHLKENDTSTTHDKCQHERDYVYFKIEQHMIQVFLCDLFKRLSDAKVDIANLPNQYINDVARQLVMPRSLASSWLPRLALLIPDSPTK